MENQTEQQQETQGKTTNHNDNQEQKQTNNKRIISPKADVLTKLDYGRSYFH
jgi:hypothetical protein